MTDLNKSTFCRLFIKRGLWKHVIAFILIISLLILAQQLLMPKYMSKIFEGALISEYYDNKGDNDVIFLGDCEVYESISPVKLWESYGIPSYVAGSAQQLIWQSYYLLEEILRFEKPDVVVFNILAMQYDEPQSEPYNRMSIDGMRPGIPKLKSIKASMLPQESFASYLFPLLRYHSRWDELTAEDFRFMFRREQKSHNGYLMRVDTKAAGTIPKPKKLADYRFGANSYKYLDMLTDLCRQKDIELVLIKAPSLYPHWYPEWESQIEEYAKVNDLLYLNYLELENETGIDYSTDTYDGGLHLNLSGAEKMTVHLGKVLQQEFELPDRSNEPELINKWQDKIDFYNETRQNQIRELETWGYLKNYGGRPPEQADN
jgi:hypothetical protein